MYEHEERTLSAVCECTERKHRDTWNRVANDSFCCQLSHDRGFALHTLALVRMSNEIRKYYARKMPSLRSEKLLRHWMCFLTACHVNENSKKDYFHPNYHVSIFPCASSLKNLREQWKRVINFNCNNYFRFDLIGTNAPTSNTRSRATQTTISIVHLSSGTTFPTESERICVSWQFFTA